MARAGIEPAHDDFQDSTRASLTSGFACSAARFGTSRCMSRMSAICGLPERLVPSSALVPTDRCRQLRSVASARSAADGPSVGGAGTSAPSGAGVYESRWRGASANASATLDEWPAAQAAASRAGRPGRDARGVLLRRAFDPTPTLRTVVPCRRAAARSGAGNPSRLVSRRYAIAIGRALRDSAADG